MNTRLEMIPAALYARVSSDKQDVDLSVAAQLRALREYAERNGYVVVREYIDEAESGRVANRPQFRQMLNDARKSEALFHEILVWKFSRFTRSREHAVAFKSMLRKRGIRVVSITEHADDSPTGRLMEAIIESVDEFYSANLAQEVTRGMRESASRGFWVSSHPPYGYRKTYVDDGPKKRPRLEIDPERAAVVLRIFQMADSGQSILDISRTFNREGIASPTGKRWSKTVVHQILKKETYTGTMIWGVNSKDKSPPVRVPDAFPAIVSRSLFERVASSMRSRARQVIHPRRVTGAFLLSGLAKCRPCRRALNGQTAKSGKYGYYVCQSLIKHGKEACGTPRLNARRFEESVLDHIRENVLTDANIRELVKFVNDERNDVERDLRRQMESIEAEITDVRTRLERLYLALETSDLEIQDIAPRIREHRERESRLLQTSSELAAALSAPDTSMFNTDSVAEFAESASKSLSNSTPSERREFIRSFVKQIDVEPGQARLRYTIPLPMDGNMPGADPEEVRMSGTVLPTVTRGDAPGTRTPNLVIKSHLLCQLS